jgi:hypothetical protein
MTTACGVEAQITIKSQLQTNDTFQELTWATAYYSTARTPANTEDYVKRVIRPSQADIDEYKNKRSQHHAPAPDGVAMATVTASPSVAIATSSTQHGMQTVKNVEAGAVAKHDIRQTGVMLKPNDGTLLDPQNMPQRVVLVSQDVQARTMVTPANQETGIIFAPNSLGAGLTLTPQNIQMATTSLLCKTPIATTLATNVVSMETSNPHNMQTETTLPTQTQFALISGDNISMATGTMVPTLETDSESDSDDCDSRCPICTQVCLNEVERNEDHSIECSACNLWHHWGCLGLTGREPAITRADIEWFCPMCKASKITPSKDKASKITPSREKGGVNGKSKAGGQIKTGRVAKGRGKKK